MIWLLLVNILNNLLLDDHWMTICNPKIVVLVNISSYIVRLVHARPHWTPMNEVILCGDRRGPATVLRLESTVLSRFGPGGPEEGSIWVLGKAEHLGMTP